jgi:hypothetical protein
MIVAEGELTFRQTEPVCDLKCSSVYELNAVNRLPVQELRVLTQLWCNPECV